MDLLCFNFLLGQGSGDQQLSAQREVGSTKTIGQESEVADADEAFGWHVQKEATQELGGSQRHLTLLAAVGVIHVRAKKQDKPKTVQFYTYSFNSLLKYEPLAEAHLNSIDERVVQRFTV